MTIDPVSSVAGSDTCKIVRRGWFSSWAVVCVLPGGEGMGARSLRITADGFDPGRWGCVCVGGTGGSFQ